MTDFGSGTDIKAVRKRHLCHGCTSHIEIGQPGWKWVGRWDGEFSYVHYHPECREAEKALNELHETFADEWMGLNEMEEDDHPWLSAEFPIVAARCGITALPSPLMERGA